MEYSAEFLELLDNVIEDGELTYKEIREIAKWMNENKSGRKLWPANLFYDLLKRVFADGKIDENEAREVANLIQSVRRDWIRKNMVVASPVIGSPITAPPSAAPPSAAPPIVGSQVLSITDSIRDWITTPPSATSPSATPLVFSIEQARLPTLPIQVLVQSSSEANVEYSVDLAGPTCTCPDFLPRSKLPIGDLSRCCKHVFQAYAQVRPKDGWTGWLDSFLELGIRPHPKTKWAVVKPGKDYV